MIVDRLKHWRDIFTGDLWDAIFTYLGALSADTPDGDYAIVDGKAHARVSRYETLYPEETILHSHKTHAEIHTMLSGQEMIDCLPVEGLIPESPYNESLDINVFQDAGYPMARVMLSPGRFALFLPHDAHRARMAPGGETGAVTKVVVRISMQAITGGKRR